jgi:EF-hand domain pair
MVNGPFMHFRYRRGTKLEGDGSMNVSAVGANSGLNAVSGASYGAPPQQKMSNLFDSIDTSGSGSITQAQFQEAFQTQNPPAVFQKQGSDAIFSALDPSGSGSVSKQDFVPTMSQLMVSLRAEGSTQSGSQASSSIAASLQSLNQIDPTKISLDSPPGTFVNYSA